MMNGKFVLQSATNYYAKFHDCTAKHLHSLIIDVYSLVLVKLSSGLFHLDILGQQSTKLIFTCCMSFLLELTTHIPVTVI